MRKIIEKIKSDKILKQIASHSKEANVYAVGGVIRDFYLDKENFDKDIIIENVCAKEFAQTLAQELDATFVPLDEENKIYRLVLKDKITYVDIANPIGKGLLEDLKRRDLTINSIAINLNTLEVIDVNSGLEDLKANKIKHISEQNFIDDPLRLLRALRFQAILGFELDLVLEEILKKHVKKIHKSAQERVTYELVKLFSGDFCVMAIENMDKIGLLEELFPIVKELKKVPPNSHHHLGLFEHSIETLNQLQFLFNDSDEKIKEHLTRVELGAESRYSHLKLAAFLHDIGKPDTWTIEEDTGKHRFIKHDDVGAKMASKFLKKMKFSKKQIDYVTKMIKYHIYPSHVVAAPDVSEKIYMRLIRKMEDNVIDVILLAMADRLSARGVEITNEVVEKNLSDLNNLLNFYLEVKETLKPLPKLLSGEEIMEVLKISPSRELGIIIGKLKEAQLLGEVNTKEEAVRYILQL